MLALIVALILGFILGLYLYRLNKVNEQIAFEGEYSRVESKNIIKEAENVIEEYVKNRKENVLIDYKEKYERLKILRVLLGIILIVGSLLSIIL